MTKKDGNFCDDLEGSEIGDVVPINFLIETRILLVKKSKND